MFRALALCQSTRFGAKRHDVIEQHTIPRPVRVLRAPAREEENAKGLGWNFSQCSAKLGENIYSIIGNILVKVSSKLTKSSRARCLIPVL